MYAKEHSATSLISSQLKDHSNTHRTFGESQTNAACPTNLILPATSLSKRNGYASFDRCDYAGAALDSQRNLWFRHTKSRMNLESCRSMQHSSSSITTCVQRSDEVFRFCSDQRTTDPGSRPEDELVEQPVLNHSNRTTPGGGFSSSGHMAAGLALNFSSQNFLRRSISTDFTPITTFL